MQPIIIKGNGDDAKWDDFESFKKFIQGEVLDFQSRVASRSTPEKSSSPDYERAFIRSMEQRIVSLEKQLDLKQNTIDRLLEERIKRARAFFNCRTEEQVPVIVAEHKISRNTSEKQPSQKPKELHKRYLSAETKTSNTASTGNKSASVFSNEQQIQTKESDVKSKGSGSTVN